MGTLVGGGRTMVAAAFLKEFTGIEITFMDWIKYAMPMAIVTVPAAVGVVYLVFRPDPSIKLPKLDEEIGPWSSQEKLTILIIGHILSSLADQRVSRPALLGHRHAGCCGPGFDRHPEMG